MEFKHINCFLAVYELGSFSKAAGRLHSTQPNVSGLIADLEALLGVTLFERHARGVRPTTAGRRFYNHCLALATAANDAIQDMREFGDSVNGRIAVGIPPTLCSAVMAPVLSHYVESFPNVEVRIVEAFSDRLADMVAAQELDFAVVIHVDNRPTLTFTSVYSDRLMVVSSAQADAARRAGSGRPRLKIVRPALAHRLYHLMKEALATGRIPADKVIEIDGLSGMLEFVRRTDWTALLPVATVINEISAGTLVVRRLAGPEIPVDYFTVRLSTKPLSRPCREFIALLNHEFSKLNAAWRNLTLSEAIL